MKTTGALLTISCYGQCPYCGKVFDLFSIKDLLEAKNEYKYLLPWGSKEWSQIRECERCKHKFKVTKVGW